MGACKHHATQEADFFFSFRGMQLVILSSASIFTIVILRGKRGRLANQRTSSHLNQRGQCVYSSRRISTFIHVWLSHSCLSMTNIEAMEQPIAQAICLVAWRTVYVDCEFFNLGLIRVSTVSKSA